MSRIAVHHWQQRIAPVFDIGGRILVLEDGSAEREEHLMVCSQPLHRAEELHVLRVGQLICGAISRSMQEALAARGIVVVGFVAGDLERVIAAWQQERLDDTFAMPGCRCGGAGWRGGRFCAGPAGNVEVRVPDSLEGTPGTGRGGGRAWRRGRRVPGDGPADS